jgi:hypothetical protein
MDRSGERLARKAAHDGTLQFDLLSAVGLRRARHPGAGAGRLRSARRRLYQLSVALRRSRPVRGPLRARRALPRLGVFVSRHRKRQRGVLAQVAGHAAVRGQLLRLGRARSGRDRAAQRSDRIRDRPHRRRLPELRIAGRSDRQELSVGLRIRRPLPRLDLCAAGIWRACGLLLPQGSDHAPATPAVLYLGCGEVAPRRARVQNPVKTKSSAAMMASR